MIKLHREGTVPRLFTEGQVGDALKGGWTRSVKEIGNAQEETKTEGTKKVKSRAKRPTREDVLELRHKAQSAGIDKWDTAPLHRLRKVLENA